MTDCQFVWLALLLLSVALLASLCLNLMFCLLRRKRSSCKDQNLSRYSKSLPQTEEFCPGDTNNYSQEENSHRLHLQQENPIYGNIITDGAGSVVVYEAMSVRARDRTELLESDLNYASLDLKIAMKRKRRHQQGHVSGRISPPNQFQDRLTPPENGFLEEACLPLKDQSPMVSHSSIYLNSQQLGLEREDNENMDWQTPGEERTEDWSPDQDSEGNVCCEDGSRRPTDEQTMLSDHFVSSHEDE